MVGPRELESLTSTLSRSGFDGDAVGALFKNAVLGRFDNANESEGERRQKPEVVSQASTSECLTDVYIQHGKVGRIELQKAGCFTWHETLRLVASELCRGGEAEGARVTLKAGGQTVRAFLSERFGIVKGAATGETGLLIARTFRTSWRPCGTRRRW